MFIVIAGDPVNGFTYHGPFKDEDEAYSWFEMHTADYEDWWVAPLNPKED